jgi:hypothetical protein
MGMAGGGGSGAWSISFFGLHRPAFGLLFCIGTLIWVDSRRGTKTKTTSPTRHVKRGKPSPELWRGKK